MILLKRQRLAAAYLESVLAERHFNEACLVVRTVLREDAADAGCCVLVLCHHVKIAATSGTRQLIAKAKVVNEACESFHGWRIGAQVESLVLLPCLAYKTSHALEVHALDGIKHVKGVCLHFTQLCQFVMLVEEHAADNLGEDGLSRACDAGVIEQVACLVFGKSEEGVRHIADLRSLAEAALGLQKLDARQESAELVLPSASRGEELFEDECAMTYFCLVPSQSAEVAQCTEYGSGEN